MHDRTNVGGRLWLPCTQTIDRDSKQWLQRSSVWASHAEGIFWSLWIALIVVVAVDAGLFHLFQQVFR